MADAYLRIGNAAKGRQGAVARARPVYLHALFRARDAGSLEGVLRATEALAGLGDLNAVERGIRIADGMAAWPRSAAIDARLSGLRRRLDTRLTRSPIRTVDPLVELFPDEVAGP